MTTPTADGLMYQIVARVEEINRVASRLTGVDHGVFQAPSLQMPRLYPAELGFLRSVSWLFVSYYEAGKVGVAFLEVRLERFMPRVGNGADGQFAVEDSNVAQHAADAAAVPDDAKTLHHRLQPAVFTDRRVCLTMIGDGAQEEIEGGAEVSFARVRL